MQRDEHIDPGAVPNAELPPTETGIPVETAQQITELERHLFESSQAQQEESTGVREAREIAGHQAALDQYGKRSASEPKKIEPTTAEVPDLTPALIPTLEPEQLASAAKKLAEKADASTSGAREVLALLKRIGSVLGGPDIIAQVSKAFKQKKRSDGKSSG